MNIPIVFVDAFTDTLFSGNSAAVVITDTWLNDDLMQSIARENNVSETAFVVASADNKQHIRWFSPITEVAFCGHATLAAAWVLFEQSDAAVQVVSAQAVTTQPTQPVTTQAHSMTFYAEAVGDISVQQLADGALQMSFPNRKPEPLTAVPKALYDGLSIPPDEVLCNQQAYFAVYYRRDDVLAVEPKLDVLTQLAPLDVVVTAAADAGDKEDFTSRYFWPANGGAEDPVTGSIHAGLAPFWAERLQKTHLTAHQASKRGGWLRCQIADDRVLVSGHAVQYLSGFLLV